MYAILIHTGGAFGGHYFAYIRSSIDQKWYNFNDSNVSPIDDADIQKTFGGDGLPNTAYMLLYRKLGAGVDALVVPPEKFVHQFKAEAEKVVAEMIQAHQKALQLKLKIYFNGVMEVVDTKKD